MSRLFAVALLALVAAGCGAGGAPATEAPTPGAATPAVATPAPIVPPTAAPTEETQPTAGRSLPPGAIEGGNDWFASASALGLGDVARFTCPPDGTEYVIWGTDVYTDDSSVCTAGVHVGLISFADGGDVIVQMIEGQTAYLGTTQNGVTSREYGTWDSSFTIEGATAGPAATPATSQQPSGPPTGSDLSPEAQEIMAHVPAAIAAGECGEVTSFDAGVITGVQCINIPDVAGYVVYKSFDTSENLATSFQGNYEFFGGDSNAQDCSVGPSLVAHERGGISEGRLMCNSYESSGPGDLIAIWIDDGLLLESTLVAYSSTYPDMYTTYLAAAAIE